MDPRQDPEIKYLINRFGEFLSNSMVHILEDSEEMIPLLRKLKRQGYILNIIIDFGLESVAPPKIEREDSQTKIHFPKEFNEKDRGWLRGMHIKVDDEEVGVNLGEKVPKAKPAEKMTAAELRSEVLGLASGFSTNQKILLIRSINGSRLPIDFGVNFSRQIDLNEDNESWIKEVKRMASEINDAEALRFLYNMVRAASNFPQGRV